MLIDCADASWMWPAKKKMYPPRWTLLDSTILFIGLGDRSQKHSVAASPFILGGWRIRGSQPAFWVLSWSQHPIQMACWGVMGRTCSSSGSAFPARRGWWLFHSQLLSAAVL